MNPSLRRPVVCVLAAVFLAFALIAVRIPLQAGSGLAAQYYENATWTEPPAFTAVDTDISTAQLTRRWKGSPPEALSVRWLGYLTVDAGTYDFRLTSDDAARFYIDSRLLVDNSDNSDNRGNNTSKQERTASVQLARGPHLVMLDYAQPGLGLHDLRWSWSSHGEYVPVPSSNLWQRRAGYSRVFALQALDDVWWCVAALVVASALWTACRGRFDRRAWTYVRQYPRVACLLLFIGLTIIETWPLATSPAHLSRNDNGDTILNEWTIAWVAHQVVHNPLHLFQGNIFYPEADVLAFSEAMLVQSAFAAPVLWLGGSPVLAYNLVMMAGFALTGFAMCLVIRRWTGDWTAGIVAGIIAAFNAHTLTRMPHLQAQHVEFLPFALLALDALLMRPRFRHAFSLAVWFTLQSLCSYYLFVMASFGMAVGVLVRPESWWGDRGRRALAVLKDLAISAALASFVLLPYLLPYWHARQGEGFNRSVEDLLPTFWQDYLTTPARFDYALLQPWVSSTGLFPGFLALGLSIYAIAKGALKDPRARMCLALGLCGVVMSFGANIPGFWLLYSLFPPLHGIRAISRFGYFGIVAVAVLGGYGVATLRSHLPKQSIATAAVMVVAALVFFESLAAPIWYRDFDRISPIYHRLDAERGAVVAELPMATHQYIFVNASAMLNSTASFYHLLNGYSGFIPQSYFTHYDGVEHFPEGDAIAALRRYGVTHIFVHPDSYEPAQRDQMRRTAALRQIAADESVILYAVDQTPR